MTGPSAMGSLYGIPTSNKCEPRAASSFNTAAVNARSGSPAVTKGINAFCFSRRSRLKSSEMFDMGRGELAFRSCQPRDFRGVFIAAAGEADEDGVVFRLFARQVHGGCHRVRAFEGRQNAFAAGERVESGEGIFVEAIRVTNAAAVFPVAVFGADARIVEAGRHRVHVAGLAVIILHDVAIAAMEDAGLAVTERSGVVARFIAATAGF